jgi:hypothetical protein
MINTCGLRLLLVRAEQRSLGVLTPRPPIGGRSVPPPNPLRGGLVGGMER